MNGDNPHRGEHVVSTPGLVAFWDFQSRGVDPRVARGRHPACLQIGDARAQITSGHGVFGDGLLAVEEGGWLFVPREELGPLNIHGPRAQVTIVAWVRRATEKPWQAVAGVWNESRSKRQYYLFLNARGRTRFANLERIECRNRIHGHISASGGKTPGRRAWVEYASGGTELRNGVWHTIAMSYDGACIRVYLDGTLDREPESNPFPYPHGVFDGGPDGARFTVGANSVRGEMSNFFSGDIGGVAVFDTALSEQSLHSLWYATRHEQQPS